MRDGDLHALRDRQLLDEPSHLAVADDEDRISAKNSSCSRCMACCRSAWRRIDGDVPPRRRLRDHPQRHLLEHADDARGDRRLVAQPIADRAEQRHLVLDRHLRELRQRLDDRLEMPPVVHRHRHADLRRRHDVDRRS